LSIGGVNPFVWAHIFLLLSIQAFFAAPALVLDDAMECANTDIAKSVVLAAKI
jgi:hypothetical protein